MKKSKTVIILSLIALVFILSGCSAKEYSRQFFAMDTDMYITAYGDNTKAGVDKAVERIKEIESLISSTIDTSDVSKINKNQGLFTPVSNDTMYILQQANIFSEKTGGALDITIAPITNLWNINGTNPKVPADAEIKKNLALVNYKNAEIYRGDARINIQGGAIDLGALGKGYASDEVVKVLKDSGVKSALVNLGGNVAVMGKNSDKAWNVAIRNPDKTPNDYLGYLPLTDKFAITSGDYERYFVENGKRYFHIFDPKTGYPAESGLRSVTVISDNGTQGDALSTALFVMGLDKALEYYNNNKDFEAVFVTSDKQIICTDGIKSSFVFTAKNEGYKFKK